LSRFVNVLVSVTCSCRHVGLATVIYLLINSIMLKVRQVKAHLSVTSCPFWSSVCRYDARSAPVSPAVFLYNCTAQSSNYNQPRHQY